MEEQHYLRVEGVNIYANLGDTNQLSVIRGGSFLLKDAIESVSTDADFSKNLEPISTGASEGVFRVLNLDSESALTSSQHLLQLEKNVADYLSNHRSYRFLTFTVVSCTTQNDDYQQAKKQLIANSRFRQLQQLTAPADPKPSGQSVPCAVEGIRPAWQSSPYTNTKWDNAKVSESVVERLMYGIEKRKSFYFGELDLVGRKETFQDIAFTDDIESLAANPEMGLLNNKIAVVYFDGNGFGKIQAETVKSADDQKAFDNAIKMYRADFLAQWLQHLKQLGDSRVYASDETSQSKSKRQLRFETLLWGGDEMLFVVPAWLGIELIQFFYQVSKEWEYGGERLTHAGGVVFCRAKSPLYRIRMLAQELADALKETPSGREQNLFDYMVLESIDYPAEELDDFLNIQYGNLAASRTTLKAVNSGWAEVSTALQHIAERVPRSQLYALAQLARHLDGKEPEVDLNRLNGQQKRLAQVVAEDTYLQLLTITDKLFLSPPDADVYQQSWRWLHLVELWDYLSPLQNKATEEAE